MTTALSPSLHIRGGTVLRPDGSTAPADVACEAGVIASIDATGTVGVEIDATDALVLPGLVDIHGDGFERTVMPRAGVSVDVGAALAETRGHLLAAGITSAFISVTDGWEPGLRSRETLRELVAVMAAAEEAGESGPSLRLHVRHERCNTDDIDELVGWIADGSVDMLSYNDHTPGGIAGVSGVSELHAQRAGVSVDELTARQDAAVARRDVGWVQEEQLAEAALAAGIPTASHDASSDADLLRDLALGVAIAEFPLSIELASRYRDAGVAVLLGAPNLVRGHSHLGNLSVREAWQAGVADLICSDYHYQSQLHAPFALTALGVPLADAWHAVSRGPAEAVGLLDRGMIETGARADLVVVEPPTNGRPARVRAVVVAGRLASLTP